MYCGLNRWSMYCHDYRRWNFQTMDLEDPASRSTSSSSSNSASSSESLFAFFWSFIGFYSIFFFIFCFSVFCCSCCKVGWSLCEQKLGFSDVAVGCIQVFWKQAGQSQILVEVCSVRATPLFIRQTVQWFQTLLRTCGEFSSKRG